MKQKVHNLCTTHHIFLHPTPCRYVQAEQEEALRISLLQPVSEGSETFVAFVCCCCCCGVVLPIILLCINIEMGVSLFTVVGVSLLVLGCLFFCSGIYPSLCPQPETPPSAFPLVHPPMVATPKKAYVLVNPMGGVQAKLTLTLTLALTLTPTLALTLNLTLTLNQNLNLNLNMTLTLYLNLEIMAASLVMTLCGGGGGAGGPRDVRRSGGPHLGSETRHRAHQD